MQDQNDPSWKVRSEGQQGVKKLRSVPGLQAWEWEEPLSEWREGLSPTALVTGHRPLRVVLTVTEVGHEVVKPDNSTAAKHSVVTGNL